MCNIPYMIFGMLTLLRKRIKSNISETFDSLYQGLSSLLEGIVMQQVVISGRHPGTTVYKEMWILLCICLGATHLYS